MTSPHGRTTCPGLRSLVHPSGPAPSAAILQAQSHLAAGRLTQAEAIARRAVTKDPRDPHAALILGLALRELNRLDQAATFLERAARLNPRSVDALVAFGDLCQRTGRFNEGQDAIVRAIEADPSHEYARVHHADLLLMTGRPEEAAEAARATMTAAPDNFFHAATFASFTCYASTFTPEQRLAAHRAVAHAVARVPAPPLPSLDARRADADPDRPLRVAYLSPDFLTHSVSSFFEPIVAHADPAKSIPHCYFASRVRDATTDRLQAHVARAGGTWRDLHSPNEAQVAALLREDRVDIAIDLAGYTGSSILWALRQRVVPIQATYLGYPHSTALPSIDARFVDSITDPAPDADALATERLVRLDPVFLCYTPPGEAPAVAPPPSATGAPFTFGSFNLLGKVSAATRATWARILNTVPNSRLLLKDACFGTEPGRERYRALLAASGIDPSRVDLIGKTRCRADHLALYGRLDLALDPFPYAGTTTTCEALFMGVPVLTLAGRGHAERVGASLLSAISLHDLIAGSADDYVTIATRIAADPARLASLRAGLRERLLASPLCDAPAFVSRWESALRALWRGWCARAERPA